MGYRIVVGVSRRSSSPDALRWAAQEARAHGGTLVAFRAWRPSVPPAGSRGTPQHDAEDARRARAAAEQALGDEVAAVLGADHGAEVALAVGGRRRTLMAAAAEADLIVVQAPRIVGGDHPGFLPRLLRSAPCPVVVVPRTSEAG